LPTVRDYNDLNTIPLTDTGPMLLPKIDRFFSAEAIQPVLRKCAKSRRYRNCWKVPPFRVGAPCAGGQFQGWQAGYMPANGAAAASSGALGKSWRIHHETERRVIQFRGVQPGAEQGATPRRSRAPPPYPRQPCRNLSPLYADCRSRLFVSIETVLDQNAKP